MPRFGLYVHLPFCPQRCPYCAFAVVTGRQDEAPRYVDGVCAELARWSHLRARAGLDTVFFGGGTPTRVAPALLGRILEAADRHLGLRSGAEITVEANPSTADGARFAALRGLGCNRLSLGAQAFADGSLRRLGRAHSAADAERAYGVARDAGFASVSLDLIFTIPGAPAEEWEVSLGRAVALGPDHVSAYALSVEAGTPFARRRADGQLPEVPEDVDAAEYAMAVERLTGAGFEHYEISNFARPGHRCAHNWDCWTGGEYLGVGMSAHSCLDGRRFWNTSGFDEYLARIAAAGSAHAGDEVLEPGPARGERLWLGLRTCAGVELEPLEMARLLASDLWVRLAGHGHAVLAGTRLCLTERGFAVADAIAAAVAVAVAEAAPALAAG